VTDVDKDLASQDGAQLQQLALQLAQQELPAGWTLVGSSVHARVAWQRDQGLYYKEFLARSPLESIKALLRGSRATRARRQNDALRAAGFSAPLNVAWGKLPGGCEYLFSSAVPGRGVTQWLRGELTQRQGESLRMRRALLFSLGTFIGRLHAAGFIHGDLRTSNVLASRQEGEFTFALIDNERNCRQQPAAGMKLLRNLMQLNMLLPSDLTATDRMRFFTAWRTEMPELSVPEARLLGVEAYRWAMRRLRAKGKL